MGKLNIEMKGKRKTILIISAFPPNNQTAGQSNTNSVISDLIAEGYAIDLITFSFKDHIIEEPARFGYNRTIGNQRPQKYFYSLLLLFLFPVYTHKFSFRIVFFLLKNQHKYDVIYLDYSQVFIYSRFIREKDKVILMVHDLMFQRFSRKFKKAWYKKIVMRYIFFSESYFFKKASQVIVPSFKDKTIAKNLYGIEATAILPKNRFIISENGNSSVNLKQFVFLGAWNRNENLDGLKWFAQKVVPLLDRELEFIIIGKDLPSSLKSLLPDTFKAIGFVDDFTMHLQTSSALISPLFLGAGIKFKVLDALSNGCRVIGTDISFEGITVHSKNIFYSANTAHQFADAIHYCSKNEFDQQLVKQEFKNYISNYKTLVEII